MKKVIIASLVFLMIGAAAVYAESTSLIGRKVQSEAVVTLDGERLGSVIIIDGVSYAPVRVIAEASGLNAGYKKGEVMLTTNTVNTASTAENKDVDSLTKEKRQLTLRADFLTDAIASTEYSLAKHRATLDTVDQPDVDFYVELITQIERENVAYTKELAKINERLAEIDELLK